MEIKKELRLAELEQMEAVWKEREREIKCWKCNAVIGHAEFEGAAPYNRFKPATPTEIRVRKAIPLLGRGIRRWTTIQMAADLDSLNRPYTDLTSAPLLVEIKHGVRCHECRAETRWEGNLITPFRYAKELAHLRWQRWQEQNACTSKLRQGR